MIPADTFAIMIDIPSINLAEPMFVDRFSFFEYKVIRVLIDTSYAPRNNPYIMNCSGTR